MPTVMAIPADATAAAAPLGRLRANISGSTRSVDDDWYD
jgi:hypothetical protein